MKLLNNIEKINEDILSINKDINNLLSEQVRTGNPILDFFIRRKIRDIVIPDLDKDKDKLSKEVKDWLDSDEKEKNVDDVVDEIKDNLGVEEEGSEEELKKMIEDIVEKQEKLIRDLQNDSEFNTIRIKFPQPIDFDIRKGKAEGKKLKLEGQKSFDVYSVEKKGSKTKIYFNYETRKQNWLRDYNVLFSILLKNPQANEDYNNVRVDIAYVDDSALRAGDIRIIDEKILTKRALIKIKRLT